MFLSVKQGWDRFVFFSVVFKTKVSSNKGWSGGPMVLGKLSVPVRLVYLEICLVGCFRLSGPLRQYFSLYRAVSQREGESGEKDRRE